MRPIRIVLADDHPLIREAIGHLVNSAPEFELVGEAASGKECWLSSKELRPTSRLDIAMPEMNGDKSLESFAVGCLS